MFRMGLEDIDTAATPAAYTRALEKHEKKQRGIERRQGAGATDVALKVAEAHLHNVTEAVSNWFTQRFEHDQERSLAAQLRYLRKNEADAAQVVSLCLLQSTIHCVVQQLRFLGATKYVGAQLAAECWGAKLTRDHPGEAKDIEIAAKERYGDVGRRRSKAHQDAVRRGYQIKDWPFENLCNAGAWGLALIVQVLPEVFDLEQVEGPSKFKTEEQRIVFKPGATVAAEALVAAIVKRHPIYAPQVAAPDPWVGLNKGGPTDARLLKSPLVRNLRHNDVREAAIKAAIKKRKMRAVLDAVNTLQNVPWLINRRVLDVLRKQFEHEKREHRSHELDQEEQSERVTRKEVIGTAEKIDEKRFWTPMNIDWRGRVYNMTTLDHLGAEYKRALFLFANGEPIGEEGLYWLNVHLANCGEMGGIHKKPFDERVKWTEDHRHEINLVAAEPLKNLWWKQAEKPFLFLAACFELSDAWKAGPAFETRLPVAWDGTCSGLQHMCAMTRDEKGKLVNLVPHCPPQDMYLEVADRVIDELRLELRGPKAERTKLAELWLDYFDKHRGNPRKAVKKNVMSYFYSSLQWGLAEQQKELMADLKEEVERGERTEHPFGDQQDAARHFFAELVFKTIPKVAPGPAQVMKLLKKIAEVLADVGKPVCWTTPVGLPWINQYTKKGKGHQIKLWMHDRGVRPLYYEPTSEIDKKEAMKGVAPNFVHACDAAHLMMTVNAAAAEGITNIVTVHDSFGCLAPRAERFRRIIREQFVQMYEEHDVLAEILDRAKQDLGEKLTAGKKWPELPKRGTLDLKGVLDSEYAFA
jgi:DNA-directed RNA polymerase